MYLRGTGVRAVDETAVVRSVFPSLRASPARTQQSRKILKIVKADEKGRKKKWMPGCWLRSPDVAGLANSECWKALCPTFPAHMSLQYRNVSMRWLAGMDNTNIGVPTSPTTEY